MSETYDPTLAETLSEGENTKQTAGYVQSGETADPATAARLKSYVERIERLEEEKAALAEDVKEVYAEAKGNGFDTKILRKCIQIRKKDPSERSEEEALIDLYMSALGG